MSRNKNHKAAFDGSPGETGEACYWARFDYLKLRETLEAIVFRHGNDGEGGPACIGS